MTSTPPQTQPARPSAIKAIRQRPKWSRKEVIQFITWTQRSMASLAKVFALSRRTSLLNCFPSSRRIKHLWFWRMLQTFHTSDFYILNFSFCAVGCASLKENLAYRRKNVSWSDFGNPSSCRLRLALKAHFLNKTFFSNGSQLLHHVPSLQHHHTTAKPPRIRKRELDSDKLKVFMLYFQCSSCALWEWN